MPSAVRQPSLRVFEHRSRRLGQAVKVYQAFEKQLLLALRAESIQLFIELVN
jgi:hypothetical protein